MDVYIYVITRGTINEMYHEVDAEVIECFDSEYKANTYLQLHCINNPEYNDNDGWSFTKLSPNYNCDCYEKWHNDSYWFTITKLILK